MKAAIIKDYNCPFEIISNHPKPTIQDVNDVIVQVIAAGVNPVDYKMKQGDLSLVLKLPFPAVLGLDFSGKVIEVGSQVKKYKVGDVVFGKLADMKSFGKGSYAEFLKFSELKDSVELKPSNISDVDAAGLGVCVLTAYEGLVVKGQLKNISSPKVLIVGGSGGVGVYAIQIAKHFNATVSVICSGKNESFVRGLGADTVFDYTTGDLNSLFADVNQEYDLILDCVGGDHYWKLAQRILKPKGFFVTVVGPHEHGGQLTITRALGLISSIVWRKFRYSRTYDMVMILPSQVHSDILDGLQNGWIKPLTGSTFKLEQVQEAHQLSESHRAKGKIVIVI